MASVFLSYDRDDSARARPIAAALEKAGHSVWWDLHVRGGAQFSKVIEEALKASDAVVVLWSQRSVDSAWVRDEAAAGRDSERLVPVSLDKTEPPLGFRQFQTIDLSAWNGRGRVPLLSELLAAIEALGKSGAPRSLPITRVSDDRDRRFLPFAAAALAILAVVIALFIWRPWQSRSEAPVVAVVAAEKGAASNALARDLFIQLGRLQATNPEALRLISDHSTGVEFLLQVGASAQKSGPGADLALLDGKNRTLLWSKHYEHPSGSEADLRQQLAYSTASVLACAAEASTAKPKLSDTSHRTYLNGCAEFAESGAADPNLAAVVQMFEKLALAETRFQPAWAKLLLAESNLANQLRAMTGSDADVRRTLIRHIAEARRHHGTIPEALLAEIELLPRGAYAERLKLADTARKVGPDNPNALVTRAYQLTAVGRVNEAISDTSRALELDPLSPAMRNNYINALAYGGRLEAAADALKEAERIWPGAASVLDAKFRFHLRYGDPAVALQLYRLGGGASRIHEATMLARLDPTPANSQRAEALARDILARYGEVPTFAQVMAELGLEGEIYAAIEKLKDPLLRDGTGVLFRPTLKKFREDARFIQLARRLGLVDYWSSSGHWPDFCFDLALPYNCKAEAAKRNRPSV